MKTKIIFIVIFILSLSLISCSSIEINNEDINKFNSDLADWKNYVDVVMAMGEEHTINIQRINKTSESAKNNDDLLNAYNSLFSEYKNWSNEISNIIPPNIANDAHSYLLEFLRLAQVRSSKLISYCEGDNPNYDAEEDNELLQQAQNAEINGQDEYKRIYKYLNEEAEKLRLKKPFQNY